MMIGARTAAWAKSGEDTGWRNGACFDAHGNLVENADCSYNEFYIPVTPGGRYVIEALNQKNGVPKIVLYYGSFIRNDYWSVGPNTSITLRSDSKLLRISSWTSAIESFSFRTADGVYLVKNGKILVDVVSTDGVST